MWYISSCNNIHGGRGNWNFLSIPFLFIRTLQTPNYLQIKDRYKVLWQETWISSAALLSIIWSLQLKKSCSRIYHEIRKWLWYLLEGKIEIINRSKKHPRTSIPRLCLHVWDNLEVFESLCQIFGFGGNEWKELTQFRITEHRNLKYLRSEHLAAPGALISLNVPCTDPLQSCAPVRLNLQSRPITFSVGLCVLVWHWTDTPPKLCRNVTFWNTIHSSHK